MIHHHISAIIPVYNGERYLAEAIQSVLTQTYTASEIIVVDDGSTDYSVQVAATFAQVRLVRKTHSGLAPTLNTGVRTVRGDLLAFLDADDRWRPEKLRLQVSALAEDPSAAIVFGQCQRFKMLEDGPRPREILLDRVRGVSKSSMLVTRSAFWQVGEFGATTGAHDFLDWYARACAAGLRAVMLPQVVCERRIHDENLGVLNPVEQRRSYLIALREKLRRQREAIVHTADTTTETP
ncbi:MAG: hypothetical protein QG637_1716 [Chloroflexota bacterium]|nr:hypothetical protein [Chloroflexota bacterium]